jgi:hypothetical protein
LSGTRIPEVPGIATLVCFVFDSGFLVKNPSGLGGWRTESSIEAYHQRRYLAELVKLSSRATRPIA